MPAKISIGTKAAIPLSRVEPDSSFEHTGFTAYVTCIELVPDGFTDDGQLVMTFGQGVGTTLRTEQYVTLLW